MSLSEKNVIAEIVERVLPCEGSWCAEGGTVGVTCFSHKNRLVFFAVALAVIEQCARIVEETPFAEGTHTGARQLDVKKRAAAAIRMLGKS